MKTYMYYIHVHVVVEILSENDIYPLQLQYMLNAKGTCKYTTANTQNLLI